MNQAKTLSLSELLALDPQMALPERPRVPTDLLRVTDSLTIEAVFGSASTVVFGGKAVSTLFPRLYPLLDGRNTLQEISERLGEVNPTHLQKAISMMYMKGIIEDGESQQVLDESVTRQFQSQLQFYSRYLDQTRIYRNREDVLARLNSCRVLLITDSPYAPMFVSDLAAFGLGNADVVCEQDLIDRISAEPVGLAINHVERTPESYLGAHSGHDPKHYALIVLLVAHHSPTLLESLNNATATATSRIAYAVMGSQRVQIGPIVERDFTPCFACAGDVLPQGHGGIDPLSIEYGLHIFSLACLNLLTHLAPITSADQVQILSADTLEFDGFPLYRQPGCEACGLGGAAGSADTAWLSTGSGIRHSLAWFYNENANFKRHHMIPKGHQAHYEEKNTRAAAGAVKSMGNAPTHRIAPADSIPLGLLQPYTADAELSTDCGNLPLAQRINLILSTAATRRLQPIAEGMNVGFRVVPSGGALSSQNLYLVNFKSSTLPDGVFYCNPDGGLNCVNDGLITLEDLALLAPPDNQARAPVAAVVITEAYGRVESKYLGISYRYTLSDAGAMLATLMALAPRVGITLAHTANFYDNQLSDTLRCQGVIEYPALVCLLYDDATAQSPGQAS